jgi:CheY-like chemotaxis protein
MEENASAPVLGDGAADYSSRVLVVDDDPTSLFLIEQQLLDLGYDAICVSSALEGLHRLEDEPESFGAVILDRMMPDMDGIAAAGEMHVRNLSHTTQIIMLSGADSQEEIQQGIDAGIFYYLTKPAKIGLLKSVVASAIRQSTQNRNADQGGTALSVSALTQAAEFTFRTLDDAAALTMFVSRVFPFPQRSLPGVAALLTNAVEHGLADIGFARKGELLASGTLRAEIDERLSAPELEGKHASARIVRKTNGVYLVVTDPGKGFAWRDYLTADQSRAATTHGRGIAQANIRSFDKLVYNDIGNRAAAFAANKAKIEW